MRHETEMPTRLVWNLLALWGLGVANVWYGGVRFTNDSINVYALTAILLTPTICYVLVSTRPRNQAHHIPLAFLLIISILSGLAAPVVLVGGLFNAYDTSSILVESLPMLKSRICFYDVNSVSGEVSHIVVRQERFILPELVCATPLYEEWDCNKVIAKALDEHHLSCTFTDENSGATHIVTITVP